MYQAMMSGSTIGLFLQVVPVTCLIGMIYVIFRYRYVRKQGLSIAWGVEIVRLLFVCYCTGLINLVLTPNNLWTAIWFYIFNRYSGCFIGPFFELNFNFVPAVYRCISGELMLGSWVKTMLAGNVLMFVPMGVFLPFVFQKMRSRNIVAAAIVIPVVVECIQPIMGRSFDVDDILANFAGIILGYLVAAVCRALRKKLCKNSV